MPTRRLAAIRTHDGVSWSDPVLIAAHGGLYRVWYSPDGAGWQLDDLPDLAPAAPAGLTCTNIGKTVRTIDMGWSAVPGADSYILRSQYWNLSSTTTAKTGITLTEGTTVTMNVHAVKNGIEGPASNTYKVIAGYEEKSVPAGEGYFGAAVQSTNRWRQGTWGYGGSSVPYMGWYDTEAYRYHGFVEISAQHIWNEMAKATPQISGHQKRCTASTAGIFFSRNSAVGSWGTDVTMQVSLGNGISYASGTEPPQQANVYDFTMAKVQTNNAKVGYVMPPNWFTAIFQEHAGAGGYNGLLFRPYRNDGARQPYAAINADVVYDMRYTWPAFVSASATMTRQG